MDSTFERAISQQFLPTSKDFAVHLGLERSEFADRPDPSHELDRFLTHDSYIARLQREHRPQQDIILARFAAFYLPATADRVLNVPPHRVPGAPAELAEDLTIINAYVAMLVAVQQVPYFMHYLRSTKPIAMSGKKLPAFIAQRIVACGPRWNAQMDRPGNAGMFYSDDDVSNIVQLLGNLCAAFIRVPQDEVIPPETRERLIPLLSGWARKYRGEYFGTVALRLKDILTDPTFRSDVKKARAQMKNWEVCALPTCNATENLKACSKCLTVRYCCLEHQREHWNYNQGMIIVTHKQMCHKTEY